MTTKTLTVEDANCPGCGLPAIGQINGTGPCSHCRISAYRPKATVQATPSSEASYVGSSQWPDVPVLLIVTGAIAFVVAIVASLGVAAK